MVATQCIYVYSHVEDNLLKVKLSIRRGKKVPGVRQIVLNI